MGNLNCCSGELPEDELSTSNLEEEALPTGAVKETNKNAPQEDLVEELPQAHAEEQPLSMLKAHGVVYEHDPQEDPVVELCRDRAKEQSLNTLEAYGAVCEHDSQEDPVVELCRDWAKEQSLNTLEAYGAVCEHDFIKDLTVNPACDRTEETPCDSKVALSACESDYFLESVSSSDTEDNTDSPHDCYPQTSEQRMEDNKDSKIESKNTEISENYSLVCWRNVLGGIKDNKEDQEKQE